MGDFVQLHNHTAMGSLLDSMVRVDELVAKAKGEGMPSVAVTDHGSLSSFVRQYKSCKKHGIKPIFGVEMYMVDNMNVKDKDEKKKHLLLLAKNKEGLKNLFKLVTIGGKHFYKKPQIDFEVLKKYKEGLIVSSACLGGKISQLALNEQYDEMESEIKKYKAEFGDDYYLEIMANKMDEQIKVNKVLATASDRLNVPLIATNDIHYLNEEDFEAHDILLAVQTHAEVDEEDRFKFPANEFYFKDYEEMKDGLFNGDPKLDDVAKEALKNTLEVSNKIEEFELELGHTNFPNYDNIPNGYDADSYLTAIVNQRLNSFASNSDINYQEYKDRLEHELEVITTKGFSTYFLVTADIVGWAKSNDILIGAGRGSAGSSLVSYLLGIIEIDPIEYNLIFSRFLNKERTMNPDVDTDVGNKYREDVIQYIRGKYGAENVTQICTFGTMSTKAVLKDVGRALGLSFGLLNDEIVPLIDDDADDLEEALALSVDLQRYKKEYPKLFKNAIRLEGIPRHLGKHAGAVIISPKPINEITALSQTKGDMITQTEMHDSEALGMLKIDLLGLKTLDLVQNTIEFIHEREDLDEFDWIPTVKNLYKEIDLEDSDVYKNIYQKADTSGVFQVESDLYHQLLESMQPNNFEHIIALLAIGRPSILQADLDKTFMDRLHGIEEPEYPHPDLEDALKPTFGIMLYQEQVLEVARTIAGFSYGEADILRRIIGHKEPEEMEKMKVKFIKGAIKEGYSKDFANEIFELIEYFAGYGFNRCIAGDTLLERSSGNQHAPRKFTIKELYETWNGNTSTSKKYRNPDRGISILSMCSDGRVRPRQVKKVYKTGKKELYKLELEDGRTIKSTKDHKFMTSDGEWKRLKDLSTSELLLVKGEYELTKNNYSLTQQEQSNDKDIDMAGHKGFYSGENNFGYINGAFIEFEESKKIVYKRANGICEICGSDGRNMEYHHKDRDRRNNKPSNIQYLCNSCHKKEEYKLGRNKKWDKGYPVIPTEIVDIEYIGEEMTYDLEMYSDNEVGHNYIANDIVTHNSHSTGYAKLSYITAWLKNYFPVEFYASLLTLESDKPPKESKMNKYISECYQKEITIKPPHINKSAEHFNVVDGGIVFGIKSIKGVGNKALEDIMNKRPFIDFLDFYERVNSRVVNKTVVESLIKTGAFNDFNSDRNQLLHYYYELRDNDLVKQYLLPQYNKATKKDIMKYERKLLSFSVTNPSKWEQANVGDRILYEGCIRDLNLHTTSNNNKMVFFDLEFDEGIVDVVAFPRKYYKHKDKFKDDNKVKVLGEKSDSNSLELIGIEEIA